MGVSGEADVEIVTSGGRRIPVHSGVLASASPVLESLLDRQKHGNPSRVIAINGVPFDALEAFVRSLYSSRSVRDKDEREEVGKYGVHLLVLSHAYQVGWLKRACEAELAARLTAECAVDVLQLARQCDAPRLYLRCMKMLAKDFAAVEKTEAWRFVQANDPWLELEVLQYLHDDDLRKKRRRRKRKEEQGVYAELSEAMECLRHICIEGCTEVGPMDRAPPRGPCGRSTICQGLQLLIRHFATCHRKGCPRCQRMWQLLRLHSAIRDQPDPCKVPLCTQFKLRMMQEMEGEGKDDKWRILVKKVMAAKVMSCLAKRKRNE